MNKLLFDPFTFAKTSGVGFDDMFKKLEEMGNSLPKATAFPPYNIKKVSENHYVIEIAVAGFSENHIDLELQDGVLTVKGNIETSEDPEDYIFRGIANRAFTRHFTLADTIQIKNAEMLNGMLKIWLERFIPEEKKPKKIKIESSKKEKELLAESEK